MTRYCSKCIFKSDSFENNTLIIPLPALPGLTASEANEATGDGREVLRSIYEAAFNAYNALSPTAKPTKMILTKSNPQGIGINQISQAYSASFSLNVSSNASNLIAE
jgi:hypothetical protein